MRLEYVRARGQYHFRVVEPSTGCLLLSKRVAWERVDPLFGEVLEERAMGLLKKLAAARGAAAKSGGQPDKASATEYPGIVELMTSVTDEAGHARDLSTLSIKWQDGCWKIAIHEVNHEMSLWASASTLEEAFAALEGRLQSEDADWRGWQTQKVKAAQKRGK